MGKSVATVGFPNIGFPFDSSPYQWDWFSIKLFIQSLNDALDNRGNRSQGFDVLDETGRVGWLRPSLRLRLECGRLDLNPGDTILADDFIYGGRQWPLLVAGDIRKVI